MLTMSHDKKYDKWDKFEKEELQKIEAEEEIEKRAADIALGKDKQPMSEEQKSDEAVREIARKAKIAAEKQNEVLELAQLKLIGESGVTTTIDQKFIGDKKVIVIKEATDCTYIIDAKLQNIIKVFIESCTGCKVSVGCKLITSHVEISHCEGLDLTISGESVVRTLQLDLTDKINIDFDAQCFVVGSGLPECDETRIVHSGVKNMKIKVGVVGSDTKLFTECDYLALGAVQEAGMTPEEIQFVTRVRDSELKTERVLRLGQIITTESELAHHGVAIDNTDGAGNSGKNILLLKECEVHKRDGNESFQAREYTQAVLFYTQAIEKSVGLTTTDENDNEISPPFRHICFSNRAACFLKLGRHEQALEDSNECLKLAPKYTKALFRKGLALQALKRYEEAMPVLVECIKIEPKNEQIKQALQFCEINIAKKNRSRD